MHKAGFVNIVGNPNVGKSTLMNQLVGERISIATFKSQTTRHRIMGIVNTEDMQIVFSDTPGVLKPNYKMQEMMLAFSESALADADVLLYVTDVIENPEKNLDFLEKVRKMQIPVLLLINKIDELPAVIAARKGKDGAAKSAPSGARNAQEELGRLVEKWHQLLPNAEILPLSAKNKFGVDMLLKRIKELLPDSPPSGEFQGERAADRHPRHNLRGARQPERHHHRPSGSSPEEGGSREPEGSGALLRQEDISRDIRKGRQRLAKLRPRA